MQVLRRGVTPAWRTCAHARSVCAAKFHDGSAPAHAVQLVPACASRHGILQACLLTQCVKLTICASALQEDPDGQEWLDVMGGAWNKYLNLPDDATNADMYKVMYPYNYGYPWEVRLIAIAIVDDACMRVVCTFCM